MILKACRRKVNRRYAPKRPIGAAIGAGYGLPVDDNALLTRLQAAVGSGRVTTAPADLAPWLTDWRGRLTGDALAMVEPASTREVQAVVKLAAEARIAIVPQGGNTGMVAGGVPEPGGRSLLLSLRRMNAIRKIDPQDDSLVAEAGVILSEIHRAAENVQRRFPLSLGARDSATLGGLVAANAGGTQALRFGTMRALTLGVEAVLPDGSLFEGLTLLRKDNRGYDLSQLLIGSEGTLGVITAATLRLVPAAPLREVVWAGCATPHDALAALHRLQSATGAIDSFEIISADALALVLENIPDTRAPLVGKHSWHVLVEGRAATDASLAQDIEDAVAECLARGEIVDAVIARSETQADAFWKLRDSVAEAERIEGVSAKHDISVPVSAMPDVLVDGRRAVETRFPGARVLAFGHLGDGNIHFNVRPPSDADVRGWLVDNEKAVTAFLHDLVMSADGSFSAEHGIGRLKRNELLRLTDPARIAAMRAIKSALDPLGIMNPGALLPPLANPEARS